jgi:hypothetical protein
MSLRTRLQNLERRQANKRQPTFDEVVEQHVRLFDWLSQRGYADALAALEGGESGPAGLEDLCREQARCDLKRRAWDRIDKALAAGELPNDADLRELEL